MLRTAQTLHLHIGGDLQIPVRESKYVHPSREEQEQAAAASHRSVLSLCDEVEPVPWPL